MIIFIGGGLGNQMFEYAYARIIQEQYGIKLTLNACEIRYHGYEGRKFALNNLNVDQDKFIVKNNYIEYLLFKMKKKILNMRTSQLSIQEKYRIYDSGGLLVSLKTYDYYDHMVNYNITKYMYGNFQSWKYFAEFDDVLCQELRVKTRPSVENENIIKNLSDNNSVCVHIRRGDYVSDSAWSHLNICTYDYYVKGMEYIKSKITNPVFYIFSNTSKDLEWIKLNYDFSKFNTQYINLDNPDYEELRLMYSCKHFVISNSTFSWWAQHLSNNKRKIVVAPSVWNRSENAFDLYEEGWYLIEV